MVYKITDDCMACGDCSVVCPEEAIDDGYAYNTTGDIDSTTDVVMDGTMLPGKQKFADTFYITDRCTGCGECVDVCPTGAIVFE